MFNITRSTVPAGFTQAQLATAVRAAFDSAGFGTPYDAVSANRFAYQVVCSGGTKGTVYLQFQITSSLIDFTSASDGWNTGTHATTGSTSAPNPGNYTYYNGQSINIYGFESTNGEGRFLIFQQGNSYSQMFGWIRPANKPSWIDEATTRYIYYQTSTSTGPTIFSGTTVAGVAGIYSNGLISGLPIGINSNQDQFLGPKKLVVPATGSHGYFSDDWVEVSGARAMFGGIMPDSITGRAYFVLPGLAGATNYAALGLRIS